MCVTSVILAYLVNVCLVLCKVLDLFWHLGTKLCLLDLQKTQGGRVYGGLALSQIFAQIHFIIESGECEIAFRGSLFHCFQREKKVSTSGP